MATTITARRMMLYDPDFWSEASSFLREDVINNVSLPIATLAAIHRVFVSYKGVEYLVLNTHGGPGRVELGDGSPLFPGSFVMWKRMNPDLLSKGAQILFEGCNIGDGPVGDKFMDDTATYLLEGKGGTIGASTSSTAPSSTTGIFNSYTLVPPWGALKVYTYDTSGSRIAQKTMSPLDSFFR